MRWPLILMILSPLACLAQENTQPWVLGARSHLGFLWPHRPAAWYLVEGHAAAFEMNVEKRFNGDRPWQRLYPGAGYGFGVMYSGMANPDIIGGGVRLIPYLHLPFIHREKSDFGMRLGWGLGYIFKPFHRTENIKQIANGTRLNTAIQLMIEYRRDFGRFRASAGVSIDHWSNGAYQLPNLGLNLISLSGGVGYAISPHPAAAMRLDTLPAARRPKEASIMGAFGICEVARPQSGQYSAYAVMGQMQWGISPRSSWAVGADVFNKGTLLTRHPELRESSRLAHTQLGLHTGWSLGLGRGELLVQMGAYVYTPFPDESAFFHRLGMRYKPGRKLLLHVGLKSHWAVADHWEWGIGYRW